MMTRIRTMVRRNLPAKLIALCAAIFLWLFVMNEQNPSIEGSFDVPLEIVNAPDGYKITQDAKSLHLRVRGARSLFVSADPEYFRAYVDLSGVTAGTHSLKVQTSLPQGFELVDAKPPRVTVTLDKIVHKTLPVDLIVTGQTAPGASVAKISPSVHSVTAEGPASAVDSIARVIGYVGLSGNREDFSVNVLLSPVNTDGKSVEDVIISPNSIPVSVQLSRGVAKKVVQVRPVTDGDLPNELKLSAVQPDPLKVEVTGDPLLLEKIDSLNTEKISLQDVTASTSKTVNLDLPQGVTVANSQVTVRIDVEKKPTTPPQTQAPTQTPTPAPAKN